MSYSPNEKFQELLTLLKSGTFSLGMRTGDDAKHQATLQAGLVETETSGPKAGAS